MFRLTGVDHVVIPHDLTRTLSHIVKFSVRSSPCHPQLDIPHFKLTSKLSIQRLDLPILVPSDLVDRLGAALFGICGVGGRIRTARVSVVGNSVPRASRAVATASRCDGRGDNRATAVDE
jgi:hypothetical protein